MTGRRLLIVLALLALCAPAAPAAARIHPRPIVGIGDQQPDMFTSQRWRQLGMHDARYIAPWDVLEDPWQSFLLDQWLRAAGRAHVRAVIGFQHSVRTLKLARSLPSWRAFRREFRKFRKKYPFVHDFIAWNEANNPGSLTATRPRRAAQYYDVIAWNCRTCNVVAADVLDGRNLVPWVRAFRRAAQVKPKVWGIHNYTDANRLTSQGTRALLAVTSGQIWFTETGGVVLRRIYDGRHKVLRTIRYGTQHASRSTRYALELSCLSRRITRIYLYEWQPPRHPTSWDSGLLSPRGAPRPAFYGVRSWRRLSARQSRAAVCRGAP
jgi:hypothetical protein